jgi:hypothetical protein
MVSSNSVISNNFSESESRDAVIEPKFGRILRKIIAELDALVAVYILGRTWIFI